VGPILEPDDNELAVCEPWVVEAQRRFYMFYASDDDRRPTIQTATSEDGVFWHRQGITLTGSGEDVDTLGVRSPCVLRLHDGTLRLWYAVGRPATSRRPTVSAPPTSRDRTSGSQPCDRRTPVGGKVSYCEAASRRSTQLGLTIDTKPPPPPRL
jgi:hypothetical protein